MGSLYLSKLSQSDRQSLIENLHTSQNGTCFICEKEIDLALHQNDLDIDHVTPTHANGKDDPTNFALAHSSCNRSKQAAHLEVARTLHRFQRLTESLASQNRGPNLDDVLKENGGSTSELHLGFEGGLVKFTFSEIGDNTVVRVPCYTDKMSGFRYFFAEVPIQYLHHDDKINPRSIGRQVSSLLQEFHARRPQLHVALGYVEVPESGGRAKLSVFDGQHKVAAQVMLGVKKVPVRVFVNPDRDTLLTANTNAGTTLRQVAFDKSVQRHLGSALYLDRIERYRKDLSLPPDDFSFSEKTLVKHFKGESREMKRYILDAVRDGITHSADNNLREYVEFSGKSKTRPLSYSTIEKTFYSFFVFTDVLETPLSLGLEDGTNPRQLERDQIVHLMNILADEVFAGKYDPDVGTDRIEKKVQDGEPIPLLHLRCFRLSKEEILHAMLRLLRSCVFTYMSMLGKPFKEDRLFQYPFEEVLWTKIQAFIHNFAALPIWANKEISSTVFGGKQNSAYWQTVFETGKTPQGMILLPQPLNVVELTKIP